MFCVSFLVFNPGAESSRGQLGTKKSTDSLIIWNHRLVLWLFRGRDQFSRYLQDYHICVNPFMCKNICVFIMRQDEDEKKNLWNEIMKNTLMDKTPWEISWVYFMRSFLAFFSILPSFHFSFLNLNWIPSQFKQQQWVILHFKVAAASVLVLLIGKQSSKQLINSPVLSQSGVPQSHLCLYVWGGALDSCGHCVGISSCCVHPPRPIHLILPKSFIYSQIMLGEKTPNKTKTLACRQECAPSAF